MKEKKDKKSSKKKKKSLKSSLKGLTTAALLAGGILISTPSTVKAEDSQAEVPSIQSRVKMVREALQKKLAASEQTDDKLSYSEKELTQWGNWGNWGNWNNWRNWGNWNNWKNWGNWGNR